MTKCYGLDPSLNHYACMVDLYGRSGSVDEAKVIISRMPLQPGMVVWHTMMAACRKWGNLKFARFGFEQALQLDNSDDSAYMYMLNIYLDAEMHGAASQVDTLRRVNRRLLDV
ncbi:hypothetical protein GOP47_0013779 [Adiantum capillus-veneris]|uniref:Pentatricopeptide repeat-containing protein n=1 Tax=Adiantum capillus-veneris TaxID=13818 RepID=A0A9D4ZDJ6_ADICA|nr:hypothetical protein GOP47_0013779 [Adiantum capillus-veneris]